MQNILKNSREATPDALITGELKKGLQYHRTGQLDRARDTYAAILKTHPRQPDALHLLGVIAYESGQDRTAIDLIRRAIQVAPQSPAFYNNLANAYHREGDFNSALECYQKALKLRPDYSEALFGMGNIYQALQQRQKAIACFRQALEIRPDFYQACNNLGAAQFDCGRLQEAAHYYQKAIVLQPDYGEAHTNLGDTFREQKRYSEAMVCYQRAVEINPQNPVAYAKLGHVFHCLGRLENSIACYQKALSINSSYAEVYNDLGTAYRELGRFEKALASFKKATALKPLSPEAHNNMGIIYKQWENLEEAVSSYQKALQCKPDFTEAHYNLGNAYAKCGKYEDAIKSYRKAVQLNPNHINALSLLIRQLQQTCAWQELPQFVAQLNETSKKILEKGDQAAEMPFLTVSLRDDPRYNFLIAKSWAKDIRARVSAYSRTFPERSAYSFKDRKQEKSRLTVGYLSADFRNHATAHLMRSLFGCHDRKSFKIIGYSYGRNDHSAYRRQIESDCDQFVDLDALSHFEAAQAIYEDAVDILVDLKGYTQDSRLEISAHRPAPIQVSYLGFPGTSGADFFDYIIADRITTPPDHAPYFTENLVYLPHCYQINDHHQKISEINFNRQDVGLPDQGFVFCSFNEPYKIEPVMFDVWMDLLRKVPHSVLWLLNKNQAATENLKNEACRRGIAAERLIFGSKLAKAEHLGRLKMADLYLDTRIYNGHTTISDALWAGVPGIALQGRHFASRVAASILTAVGLPELITYSLPEYEALAMNLAIDPETLMTVKEKLDRNRSSEPLFDTPRFAASLEKAYKMMWQLYLNDETPRLIEVLDNS